MCHIFFWLMIMTDFPCARHANGHIPGPKLWWWDGGNKLLCWTLQSLYLLTLVQTQPLVMSLWKQMSLKSHVSDLLLLGDCPGSCLRWAFGQSHQGALLPDDPRAGGAMKLICWRLKKGCPERVTIPRPFRCKRNDLPLIYQDLWQFGTTSNI